jgi:predicted ATP-grasp superfamily ATP-dependent carboligase
MPPGRGGRGPGGVVLGGYVNGLGVLRAVAALGVPAAVVRTRPFDLAHRSRFCAGSLDAVGAEQDAERLVELLEARAPAWRGWALFPTNDWTLAALVEHRERLERAYRIVAPSREAVEVLLDKSRTAAVAAELGIAVPRDYGAAVAATAEDPAIEFPVLVKPRAGHRFAEAFGAKLFAARDRVELRRAIARVAARGIDCTVLDWVPGDDDAIHAHCTYLDGDGEPRGGLTVRKLRQGPAGIGVARVAEIAPEMPELREASVALLRRIGVRGAAAVEFKRDARDGSFRLLEINGRSVLYNALTRRAGLDLAALAWADFVEGRPRTATPRPWPGVWVNLHSDLLHSLVDGRREGLRLREFLAPYRRPWFDAVGSWRDPLPWLAQWSWTARRGIATLAARRRRPRGTEGLAA